MWEYRATPIRVVDGDTVDVRTNLGFDVEMKMRLRLWGVDCPERRRDPAAWEAARAFTTEWIASHCDTQGRLFVRTIRSSREVDEKDSFGKYLAIVYDLMDGELSGEDCLNTALLSSGHAVPYVD